MLRSALFIIILISAGCGRLYPTSESDVMAYFERQGQQAEFRHDTVADRPIHWAEVNMTGMDTVPIVIFVHGGGGNANHFLHFMSDTSLNRHARMITFDRLGYAPFDLGLSEVNIERQGEVIDKILTHYDHPWVLVVAHSYGGPIAMSYVIDHPEKVKAALLLAPALDPEEEPVFRSVVLTRWRLTRWAIPRLFMVAADEHLAHVQELQKLEVRYKDLSPLPIVHMHATADFIIPYSNMRFSERMVADGYLRTVTIEGGDHFLPWTAKKLVTDEIAFWLKEPYGQHIQDTSGEQSQR
jgi:pimeloyl-ACP methyl ester carboxylesterase